MIGLLAPRDWDSSPLGEIAEIDRTSVTPDRIQSGTKYIGLEHLDGEGRILSIPTVGQGDLASNKFAFGPKHILYGKLRPYLRKIVRPHFVGICSTDILPIRPSRIDRGYLYHYLRHPRMVEYASARSEGANLPRLSPTELEKFPIHFPRTLAEQQRIADILDKVDAIRQKRRDSIQLLSELERSQFNVWFSPWFQPGAEDSYVSVSHFVERFEGGLNVATPENPTLATKHFILKVSAVTWGDFRPEESKPLPTDYIPPVEHFVRNGDLLFSRANTTELVGATVFVFETPPNRVLPDKLWRFVWKDPRGAEPLFVRALFNHPKVRYEIGRRATGTSGSMKNISMDKVLSIRVPWPPIEEQRKFARFAKEHWTLHKRMSLATDESEQLFYSLVQRAFRGEL